MEGNPYSKMAQILKNRSAAGLFMYKGTVTSATPLILSVAGITVASQELMINGSLIKSDQTIALEIGDTVLLLTADDQLFYILCKVVSL
jgi:hypothetical protein